jgi:hypothetical protein
MNIFVEYENLYEFFHFVEYEKLLRIWSYYTRDSIFVDTRSGNTQFRKDSQRFVTFMR